MPRTYQLRNALTAPDRDRLASAILQDHLQLAAIVRVDGAWRVRQRDTVLQGQSRPRPHLHLESFRKLEDESRRYRATLTRRQNEIRFRRCDVVASGVGALARRKRKVRV